MSRARGATATGVVAAGLVLAAGLVGCSSSNTASGSTSSTPTPSPTTSAWQTPDDVLAAVKTAGFDCTLPSSDTAGQVLTTDPFTGTDLAGNALVRCPDFQVMLASGAVNDGFALLVKCQTVPASIRQAPEWSVPVIVGGNFIVLPSNLSAGWTSNVQPAAVIKAFGGTQSTFGEVYDASCAGRESSAGPAVSSGAGTASSAGASPAAS